MPWPILKSGLRCFNNESVEEYITRSYKIATGQPSSDLPIKSSKLFVHFTRNILPDRKIPHVFFSVLANSEKWQTFRSNIYSLFEVLLSVQKTDCFEIRFQHLPKK